MAFLGLFGLQDEENGPSKRSLPIYLQQQCSDQQHLNLQGRKNCWHNILIKILKVGDSEAIKIKIRGEEGESPGSYNRSFL